MKFVPNAVSTAAARSVLNSQKHSPKALFAIGIVGMGATVFLACKATLKVDAVLEDTEIALEKISFAQNTPLTHGEIEYSSNDVRRDKAMVYLQAAGKLGRLYGPAIVCGFVSVASLAGSHNILTKRNAALAAAYGTIEKAFNDYRERVRQAYGDEREMAIYRDVRSVDEKNPETGKTTKVKQSNGGGPYSFLFDEHNQNWEPTPEYNFLFLKLQQKFANQRLQARGHLFLNEVLQDLGMEHTTAGAVTGWIKGQGDDYVDFGVFEGRDEERILDFLTGREKAIWLDFNVDGVIYDKI